jgi:hypothetical protein
MDDVYCAVQIESLKIIQAYLSPKMVNTDIYSQLIV